MRAGLARYKKPTHRVSANCLPRARGAMAPPRFRLLLVSCVLALTLRLSHCRRRRECDCNSDSELTYVCLLRCGRGSSGGAVVVMPVKKSPVPSLFLTRRKSRSTKTDPNKTRPQQHER